MVQSFYPKDTNRYVINLKHKFPLQDFTTKIIAYLFNYQNFWSVKTGIHLVSEILYNSKNRLIFFVESKCYLVRES
jgi:hypothetical protein